MEISSWETGIVAGNESGQIMPILIEWARGVAGFSTGMAVLAESASTTQGRLVAAGNPFELKHEFGEDVWDLPARGIHGAACYSRAGPAIASARNCRACSAGSNVP